MGRDGALTSSVAGGDDLPSAPARDLLLWVDWRGFRYKGGGWRDIGTERRSLLRKDPLRTLSADERSELARLSRSRHAPAAQVARATALLAVADGRVSLPAARRAGRRDGDTVAAWVARFNREGLAAVVPAHGGGPPIRYAEPQRRRILAEAVRVPDRERDGSATWSLGTLRRALRHAED